MQRSLAILAAAFLTGVAAPAPALTIDFEDAGFVHGTILARPTGSYSGYTLTTDRNNTAFDTAVAFDTGVSGSLDPDLEQGTGYEFGNLGPFPNLGKILIIQANNNCSATVCQNPEDWGGRPAGTHLFQLDDTYATFRFDVIDIDNPVRETGGIDFFLFGAEVASFNWTDFLTGSFTPQGVVFGNHSANRIDLGEIGVYDSFRIRMGGSGGLDNFETGNPVPVPEPGTAALLWLGLVGLVARGRGRRRS